MEKILTLWLAAPALSEIRARHASAKERARALTRRPKHTESHSLTQSALVATPCEEDAHCATLQWQVIGIGGANTAQTGPVQQLCVRAQPPNGSLSAKRPLLSHTTSASRTLQQQHFAWVANVSE